MGQDHPQRGKKKKRKEGHRIDKKASGVGEGPFWPKRNPGGRVGKPHEKKVFVVQNQLERGKEL